MAAKSLVCMMIGGSNWTTRMMVWDRVRCLGMEGVMELWAAGIDESVKGRRLLQQGRMSYYMRRRAAASRLNISPRRQDSSKR